MKNSLDALRFGAGIVSMGMLGGCVVAPIPLVQSDRQEIWSGAVVGGREVVIEKKESNWYMPILASPEGAAKLRNRHWSYSYFWTWRGESQDKELPLLRVESDGGLGEWRSFRIIEGSSLILAMRIADSGQRGKEANLAWVEYEIAVFDAAGVKHRRKIRSIVPAQDPGRASVWAYIKVIAGGRYLEYATEAGLHQYATVENTEKIFTAPAN